MAAMSVTVSNRAETAAAETAIADAAIGRPSSVRPGPAVRTAVGRRDETQRYRADGGATHHGQYDTARTFHGDSLGGNDVTIETLTGGAQAKLDAFTASC